MPIFHLAVPAADLDKSKEFYKKVFAATIGREYSNYTVYNFYGMQLVLHLDKDAVPDKVKMYPRHFGIIFDNKNEFDSLYNNCKKQKVKMFQELFERYKNQHGWHASFFLQDPNNNLIEIKYYYNTEDIFK